MNANQVFFLGVVLAALGVLPVVLGGHQACAFESHHSGDAIFSSDAYQEAVPTSGFQLVARSRATQVNPGSASAGMGSTGSVAGGSSKVKAQTLYSQCYSICMARCQVTPVPVPTTNCASKCSQGCRPQAR